VLAGEPMPIVLDPVPVPGPVPTVDPDEVPGPLPAHAPVVVNAVSSLAQLALTPAVTTASHPAASVGLIAAQQTARLAHEVPPVPGPVPVPQRPSVV
jgi:hypothetical protein